jgi:uncharacterized SAM-binding protein YcdF (DUF218 family)
MPFVVRKGLTLVALPLGLVTLLLLAGLVLKKRILIAAAFLLLYFTAIPYTSDRLIGFLEGRYPRLGIEECPAAEAIVVLGGAVADVGKGIPEWTEAVDRFDQAILLKQAGKAPRLVLGGGLLPWVGDGYTEGDAMAAAAVSRGIPREAIQVVRDAANTAGEASGVVELARKEGFRKIVLVTSAFHMHRAALLFERHGLEVIPFPVDYQLVKSRSVTVLSFLPQGRAIVNSEIAFKEIYGILYYRLAGRWLQTSSGSTNGSR